MIKARKLKAEIVQVVAGRPRIGAIQRAMAAGIPLALADRAASSRAAYSASIFQPIFDRKADIVILAGFLSLVDIPDVYRGKVINIHPALIPSFSGQGFHGRHVHEAVLEMGCKLAGCTVHFADANYDTGPIIVQKAVPVLDDDNPDTLGARVFQAENQTLPEAINLYAAGRLKIEGRHVRILAKS